MSPASAETFSARVKGDAMPWLTIWTLALGLRASRSAVAWSYGASRTLMSSERKNQATIVPTRIASAATTSR